MQSPTREKQAGARRQELAKLVALVENIARSRGEKLAAAKAIMREAWDLGKQNEIAERRDQCGGISADEIIRQQGELCRNAGVNSIGEYNIKRAGLCEQAIKILEELIPQTPTSELFLELFHARFLQGHSLESNDHGSLEAARIFAKAIEAFDKVDLKDRDEGSWSNALGASYKRCSILLHQDAAQAVIAFDKHVSLLSESPKAGTSSNLLSIAHAKWFRAVAILNPPSDEHLRGAIIYAEEHWELPKSLQNKRVKSAFLDAARAFEAAIFASFRDIERGQKKDSLGINHAFESMNRSFLMAGEPGKAEEARQRIASEWGRIEAKQSKEN